MSRVAERITGGQHPAGQQEVQEHEAPGSCSGGRLPCRLTSFAPATARLFAKILDKTRGYAVFYNCSQIKSTRSPDASFFTSVLYQIAWNKTIFSINRNQFVTHTDDAALAACDSCIIQNGVFFDFTPVGGCGFYNLQWVDQAIFLHKHVDLLVVGTAEIGEVRLVLCISIILHKLHNDIVFIIMTACRAVHQCIFCQPQRKKSAQPCVAKV